MGGDCLMEITEVRISPVEEEKLKAYVSITLDNCFVIRDIKVINGNNGLFISMPSKKRKDGTFKDVAHPLNNDTRKMIEERVLREYNDVLKNRGTKV
jgi:stage V sporulation protein G